MSRYIPNSEEHRRRMLGEIGVDSFEDLLGPIPERFRLGDALDLPPALSELELQRDMADLSSRDTGADYACFLGGGAYDHFVPAAIDHVLLRSEFYTAYTPYQAEVSQGTLQAIFEYQTMISRLTGMEFANASVYDGASAAAEACLMALRISRKSERVLIAGSLNPRWAGVVRTYLDREGFEINEIPFLDSGLLDLEAAGELADGGAAALLVQFPDYFGSIQDLEPMAELIHAAGGLLIAAADPVALPLLRSPGDAGADIVVGEGQSLGLGLSYGGPYAGFMSSKTKLARKMPGRIIGRTVDRAGETGYVMTLQTREQHIRREKATSNICTNQALMALANTVYLSLMGDRGFREVSEQCFQKSHYLFDGLLAIDGVEPVFGDTPFFREFAVRFPVPAGTVLESLAGAGILGGLPLQELGEGVLLVTATEKRTKEEMDAYICAVSSARITGEVRS